MLVWWSLGVLLVAALALVFFFLPAVTGNGTRNRLIVSLFAMAAAGAGIASLVAFVVLRRSMNAVRRAIDDLREGRTEAKPAADPLGVGADVRKALEELEFLRKGIDATHTDWTPETLSVALANELPGQEVIVVSNREPYIHNRMPDGSVSLQIPASGLVSALEPVTRACRGTWIAHGSGTADREMVDGNDRVAVPPMLRTTRCGASG